MLQIIMFNSTQLEVIHHEGQVWLKADHIAKALGYQGADQINKMYVKHASKFTRGLTMLLPGQTRQTRIFSLHGCILLSLLSKTAQAKAFARWLQELQHSLHPQTLPHTTGKKSHTLPPLMDYQAKTKKCLAQDDSGSACAPHIEKSEQAALASLSDFNKSSVSHSHAVRESDHCISQKQRQHLAQILGTKVRYLPKPLHRKGFNEGWKSFNRYFSISRHKDLPAVLYPQAVDYMQRLRLRTAQPDYSTQTLELERLEKDIILKQSEILLWAREVEARFNRLTGPVYQKVCLALPFQQRSHDQGLACLHTTSHVGLEHLRTSLEHLRNAARFALFFQRSV